MPEELILCVCVEPRAAAPPLLVSPCPLSSRLLRQQVLVLQPLQHQAPEGPVRGGCEVTASMTPSAFSSLSLTAIYLLGNVNTVIMSVCLIAGLVYCTHLRVYELMFPFVPPSALTPPPDWAVPQSSRLKYRQLFNSQDKMMSGHLTGE